MAGTVLGRYGVQQRANPTLRELTTESNNKLMKSLLESKMSVMERNKRYGAAGRRD